MVYMGLHVSKMLKITELNYDDTCLGVLLRLG